MKCRWPAAVLLLLFVLNAEAADPRPKLTDPQVAAKLRITVQELHRLRSEYGFDNTSLLGLPRFQLQLMLREMEHPGWDKHAAEEEFRALRMMDEHGRIPPDGLLRALEHRRRNQEEPELLPGVPDPSTNAPEFGNPGAQAAGIQSSRWTWLGPGNIGGRVRAILTHPELTNVLWCGGVDGGVWKSTNSGASWFPLDDFMPNLAVACLAMDPLNFDIIYAGTGEPTHNSDAIRGAGIFKSADAGFTWARITPAGNSQFNYVGRIAIDPHNGNNLLAATRSGIQRSVDGGTNWVQVTTTETLHVAYHPMDSAQCVAGGYVGNAWYSLDSGATWTAASGLPSATGATASRVELGYARSNPTIVYASVDNNKGEVYVSGDGGQSYVLRNTGNSYLSSQGWYDNVIWVDPTTENTLVVGGVDLWRSTDGGATLTRISQWQSAPSFSAHADHHAIVSDSAFNGATIKAVYFGNDGGVFRALDIYSVGQTAGWECLNHNLGITQFYSGAGSTNTGVIVGGAQDNGTVRYTPAAGGQNWSTMYGGDGAFSAADPADPNYFYGSYVYLQLHRSTDGGGSSSSIYSGISDAGSSSTANFIAPFILDPNNANTMLAGGVSLWRSVNVKAPTPTWTAIKSSTASKISAIAVAPGKSDIVWVGHNNGDVFFTTNGTSSSPNWFQRDLGTPNLPNRYCERIAISPTSSDKVYITFGGFNADNVWRTTDSGATWTSISTNLPAAPVNSIVISPVDQKTLYAGTEVGIYGSSDDGATWSTGNDGPANVSVDELFWLGNKLVAATHGRGMFAITPALGDAAIALAGVTVSGGNGNGAVDPNECNQLTLFLQNAGGAPATNITAVLSSTTPGVTILQSQSAYPNLAGGAAAANLTPFRILTAPSSPCGTPVSLTMTVAFNGISSQLNMAIPAAADYTMVQSSGGTIVPGTTDVGNHADDLVTRISLPFPVNFYGQNFTNATLSSNGNLQFLSGDEQWQNACLPYTGFTYAIIPFWSDLRTDTSGGGILTALTGSAPNRVFNIEWRAGFYDGGSLNDFEIRFYEGQNRFDIIYGTLNGNGDTVTAAIQKDSGSAFITFECNTGGLSPGVQLSFTPMCADGGGPCTTQSVASFSATPTSGAAPLTVQFANASTGATDYAWDLGDGSTSSAVAPAHVYASAGTFSVTLAASAGALTNTLTRTNYIVVTNLPPRLVVSAAGIDFGTVVTGTTSRASMAISNAGPSRLTGAAAIPGGPFTLANGAGQIDLPAFAGTNLDILFAPQTAGVYSSLLTLASDGGSATISLTGRAVDALTTSILTPQGSGTGLAFSFQSLPGVTYVVEAADALDAPNWVPIQTLSGDGSLMTITNSVSSGHRFFRLRIQ